MIKNFSVVRRTRSQSILNLRAKLSGYSIREHLPTLHALSARRKSIQPILGKGGSVRDALKFIQTVPMPTISQHVSVTSPKIYTGRSSETRSVISSWGCLPVISTQSMRQRCLKLKQTVEEDIMESEIKVDHHPTPNTENC